MFKLEKVGQEYNFHNSVIRWQISKSINVCTFRIFGKIGLLPVYTKVTHAHTHRNGHGHGYRRNRISASKFNKLTFQYTSFKRRGSRWVLGMDAYYKTAPEAWGGCLERVHIIRRRLKREVGAWNGCILYDGAWSARTSATTDFRKLVWLCLSQIFLEREPDWAGGRPQPTLLGGSLGGSI